MVQDGGTAPHPPFGHLLPARGEKAEPPPLQVASMPPMLGQIRCLLNLASRPRAPLAPPAGRGWPRRRRGRVRGLAMVPDGAAPPLIRPSGTFSPLAGRRRNRRPLRAASIVVSLARYSLDDALRRCGQRPSFPSELSRRSWSLAPLAGRGWPRRRRGRVRGLGMVQDAAAPPLIRPSGTFSPLAGRRRNRCRCGSVDARHGGRADACWRTGRPLRLDATLRQPARAPIDGSTGGGPRREGRQQGEDAPAVTYLKLSKIYEQVGRFCDAVVPIESWVALDPLRNDTSQTQAIIATLTERGQCARPKGTEDVFPLTRKGNVLLVQASHQRPTRHVRVRHGRDLRLADEAVRAEGGRRDRGRLAGAPQHGKRAGDGPPRAGAHRRPEVAQRRERAPHRRRPRTGRASGQGSTDCWA